MVSSVTKNIVPELGYNILGKKSDYNMSFWPKTTCQLEKHGPRNQYRDKWRLWKYHGELRRRVPTRKDWGEVQSYLLKRYNDSCKDKIQENLYSNEQYYANENVLCNGSKRKNPYNMCMEDVTFKKVRKDHPDPIYMNVNGLKIGIQPLPQTHFQHHHQYKQMLPKDNFKIPLQIPRKQPQPESQPKAKFNCNTNKLLDDDEDEDDIELDNLLIQAQLLKPSDSQFYEDISINDKSQSTTTKTALPNIQTETQQQSQILPPTPPPEDSPIKSYDNQPRTDKSKHETSSHRHLPGSVVSACKTACLKTSKTKKQYEAVSKSKLEPDNPDTKLPKQQSSNTQIQQKNFSEISKNPENSKITHGTENNMHKCSTDPSVKRGGVGSCVKNININEKLDESKTGKFGKSVQQKQQEQKQQKEKDKKLKNVEKPEKSDTSLNTKSTKNKSDEGKIVLLNCSNCKNKTVVYPCSCKKVVYCGTVCQKKHWESEHQFSDDH